MTPKNCLDCQGVIVNPCGQQVRCRTCQWRKRISRRIAQRRAVRAKLVAQGPTIKTCLRCQDKFAVIGKRQICTKCGGRKKTAKAAKRAGHVQRESLRHVEALIVWNARVTAWEKATGLVHKYRQKRAEQAERVA